jgi:hypothetical protein
LKTRRDTFRKALAPDIAKVMGESRRSATSRSFDADLQPTTAR